MKIGGLQKCSFIDYPKKISAVIFTQGCNFRCPFCHNPELVEKKRYQNIIEESIIFDFLETRKEFLDALTISGGEPTLQEDLVDFCIKVKKMGFFLKLDTNGTNPEVLETLINSNLLDYIAMDLKAPLEKYSEVVKVGVNKSNIEKSVFLINNSSIEHEFRTTIVKGVLGYYDLVSLKNDFYPSKIFLQKFISKETLDPSFKEKNTFTKDTFKQFLKIFNNAECFIRYE